MTEAQMLWQNRLREDRRKGNRERQAQFRREQKLCVAQLESEALLLREIIFAVRECAFTNLSEHERILAADDEQIGRAILRAFRTGYLQIDCLGAFLS